MIDANTLKVGDIVSQGARTATIDMVTDEGNYVRVAWCGLKRPDILSKSSPLWRYLDKQT